MRRSKTIQRTVQLSLIAFLICLIVSQLNQTYGESISTSLGFDYGATGAQEYEIQNVVIDGSNLLSYDIAISSPTYIDTRLEDVVKKLLREMESDVYLKEHYSKLVYSELKMNIKDKNWINENWFQLSGSSVWLESNEVYFYVSRIIYSPEGKKNDPLVSFAYVQLFDKNWKEVKSLVDKGSYPRFLRIPFFNKSTESNRGKNFGPEDPRVFAITKSDGQTGVLVVYNSLKKDGHRTMNLAWPLEEDEHGLTKTIELRYPRNYALVEKNWTPFVDPSLQDGTGNGDVLVNFVYDWLNLQLLNCHLKTGNCEVIHEKFPPLTSPDMLHNIKRDVESDGRGAATFREFGPLRGGTALIHLPNVSALLTTYRGIQISQVWAGFSRYHLDECGCGVNLYRPALVVVVKDTKNEYHLAQLSSAIDFDMKVLGWNMEEPWKTCEGSSALIPNGISRWRYSQDADDMWLTFSMSDATNFRVKIGNLMHEIERGLAYIGDSADVAFAVEKSMEYCKLYGEKYKTSATIKFTPMQNNVPDRVKDHLAVEDSETNEKPVKVVKPLTQVVSAYDKLVLYPSSFEGNAKEHYLANVGKIPEGKKILSIPKYGSPLKTNRYHEFKIPLYNAFHPIKSNSQCKKIKNDLKVQISEPIGKDVNMTELVKSILMSDSEYLAEFKPYFYETLKKMLEEGTVDNYWYRFAGTSVWLEEYGVHLMVSRVLYSVEGVRDRPILSLTYAQAFDSDWSELKDVDLIIPETDDGSTVKVSYPGFVPIPTFHEISKDKVTYYGPEDPRILLRKNNKGHMEPVVIFNQKQREIYKGGEESEDENGKKIEMVGFRVYRSMYMCFIWQTQLGKLNVDPLATEYAGTHYSRVIELDRFHSDKKEAEKNWTPFFSYADRRKHGFDKSIYFVYSWDVFKVLKCDIPTSADHSLCKFDYSMDEDIIGPYRKGVLTDAQLKARPFFAEDLKKPEKTLLVGPLRGGTQLVSVNEISDKYKLDLGLEHDYWVGFARSRLPYCGCGRAMYRPHLIMVVKDRETSEYHISHMSLFLLLDIDILPWDPIEPDKLCGKYPNILLPNGISDWSFTERGDDFLTLAYTNADLRVEMITIRGLFKALQRINPFDPTKTIVSEQNVECAILRSMDFCKAYGDIHFSPEDYIPPYPYDEVST